MPQGRHPICRIATLSKPCCTWLARGFHGVTCRSALAIGTRCTNAFGVGKKRGIGERSTRSFPATWGRLSVCCWTAPPCVRTHTPQARRKKREPRRPRLGPEPRRIHQQVAYRGGRREHSRRH